jgi:thioredoxin-related protein
MGTTLWPIETALDCLFFSAFQMPIPSAFHLTTMSRRVYVSKLAHSFVGVLGLTYWVSEAAPAQLPPSKSLLDEINNALKAKEPLIVMVSLAGCPFCKMARDSYLSPMQKQGFPIVQVDMRSDQPVKALNGQMQTHDQMVKQWRVSIAPTLIFLGPKGQELVDRMEGGYLPDFYGAYLEERVGAARRILRT